MDSNKMFLNLANNIDAYIAYVNAETLQYEFVNDLYVKSFGYPKDKIIGSKVKDIIGHKNYQFALKYINEVKSGKSTSYENTFDISSGKRWIQFNYAPVFDNKRKVVSIAILGYDITDRKKADELLRENELRFRTFIEEASIAIFVTRGGIVLYANHKAVEMFGLHNADEIVGHQIIEFMAPEFRPASRERTRLRSLGVPVSSQNESVALRPDGSRFPFRMSVSQIQLSDGKANIAFVTDITEQRRIADLLRQNEERYKIMFEGAPIAISITHGTDITFANPSFLKMFGYSNLEELKTLAPLEVFAPEWRLQIHENIQRRAKGLAVPDCYEVECIRKNGDKFPILMYLARIMFMDGPETVGFIINITDRKQAEIELIKAKEKAEESDRLKSAFLMNMSHEIRTPMNGILGFTELLNEENLTFKEQQDFIQTIQKSGERMLNTINSIVDISKIESGMMNVNLTDSNINEQMEFIYKFFKPEVESKGLQFFVSNGLPSKEATIQTDKEKIYAILTNIVKNAIKFTDEGAITIGYEKKGKHLKCFVKDTGTGISSKNLDIIFERFRQGSDSLDRNYEGSGLGLSICKSYVEMLNGEIWVESEERKGSIFYFTIPYNPELAETQIPENVNYEEDKNVQLKKLKILIAEDDDTSYKLLLRTLNKIRPDVLRAKTGIEAVIACRSNPDLCLILMDIKMPDMDGYEATRQIRQFNKNITIIAQTAYGFSNDRIKAIEAGCDDYISKPIESKAFYELIKKNCKKNIDV